MWNVIGTMSECAVCDYTVPDNEAPPAALPVF